MSDSAKATPKSAFSVGLFILISLILLVAGIFWVRKMAQDPEYVFYVAFQDPDRVVSGVPVYYRGIEIGRVMDSRFTEDKQHTLLQVGITEKDLELPINIDVHIKLEGITGQRFLQIKPPETQIPPKEIATRMIEHGDQINGTENFTWDRIQAQLDKIAREKTIEKTLISAQEGMEELANASKELHAISSEGVAFLRHNKQPLHNALVQFTDTAKSIEDVSDEVGEFAAETKGPISESVPQFASALDRFSKNTEGLDDTLESFRDAANDIGTTFQTVNQQLEESNLIPKIAKTLDELMKKNPQQAKKIKAMRGQFVSQAKEWAEFQHQHLAPDNGQGIGTLNAFHTELQAFQGTDTLSEMIEHLNTMEALLDPSPASEDTPLTEETLKHLRALRLELQHPTAKESLSQTFKKLPDTVDRVNCVTSQLSHILGQRFLGFKLMFGKPGGGFGDCEEPDNLPKNQEKQGKNAKKSTENPSTNVKP